MLGRLATAQTPESEGIPRIPQLECVCVCFVIYLMRVCSGGFG